MQDVAKLVFAMSHHVDVLLLVPVPGHLVRQRAGRDAFVLQRFFDDPWRTLALVIFIVGWLIPFAICSSGSPGARPSATGPLILVISSR